MSHTHNPSLLPPDREEGTFNLMQSVKRRFYAMRNGMLAAQMRQGGVDYRINFGLNIPQIKDIAAELIASGLSAAELASLARALWDNERQCWPGIRIIAAELALSVHGQAGEWELQF